MANRISVSAIPYENKRCGRCGEVKPRSEFGVDKRLSGGLAWQCKDCKRKQDAADRAKKEPGAHRDFALKKYGITQADYEVMLAEQGGGCAICGSTDAQNHTVFAKHGTKSSLHVDHDHVTGKVRGVLCGPCNLGLGRFGDDPDRLRRAAAYLDGRLA